MRSAAAMLTVQTITSHDRYIHISYLQRQPHPPVHGLYGGVLPVEDLLAGWGGGVPLRVQGDSDVHGEPEQINQLTIPTNQSVNQSTTQSLNKSVNQYNQSFH